MDPYPCDNYADNATDTFAIAHVLQSEALIQTIERELQSLYPEKQVSSATIRRVLASMTRSNKLADDEPRRPLALQFPLPMTEEE